MPKHLNQFDIWQVDLNPTKGSEQQGIRPCLILQTNASGNYGRTTLIAPITSKKTETIYPFEVKIEASNYNKLPALSKIKFDQIRVIDKSRLVKKIGVIEKKYFSAILSAFNVIFDLDGNFR